MLKVLIWGTGIDYDRYFNSIRYQEVTNQIKVIGVVSKSVTCKKIDGYPFISKKEIKNIDFDILVIASMKYYYEIREEAMELGIPEESIIKGSVFLLPELNLKKYLHIKNSRLTIFSINCWGGLIYHRLGMEFLSPFINTSIPEEHYLKLLKSPHDYMKEPLKLKEMAYNDVDLHKYPICYCGDILLAFNHYHTFEEADQKWNERKLKINWSNLFVMMFTTKKKVADEFINLSYQNKICFVPFKTEEKSLFYLNYQNIDEMSELPFWKIVNYSAKGNYKFYDILDLLNGIKKNRIEML